MLVVCGLVVGGACGSSSSPDDASTSAREPSEPSESITVFAASSLTAPFTEIGAAFMSANPGSTVTFNFAASSELVTQIGEGAPADVFASADLSNMERLTRQDRHIESPAVFATNIAEIVVEPGNPEGIDSIADLERDDLIVVQCALEVPCGSYAAQIFDAADVMVTPSSYEENVKAVVAKVALGEADAGIVYASDVVAAGSTVAGVAIPSEVNVVAQYPIVVLDHASSATTARAFVAFVLSDVGQAILIDHGFRRA